MFSAIKKEFIRGGLLFVFDKDKTDLLSPQAQGKFLEKVGSPEELVYPENTMYFTAKSSHGKALCCFRLKNRLTL